MDDRFRDMVACPGARFSACAMLEKAVLSLRILILIAVLSGIAGLGYQVVWSEQLALLLGSTQVAVAAVLAAFMLGLTIGAALISRFCDRLVYPLRIYAYAEIFIAVTAQMMRPALGWVDAVIGPALGSSLDGTAASPVVGGALVLVGAVSLMLLPTVAMGATLPLLVEAANGIRKQTARNAAALYSANTFGAAFGAFASALFLLPSIGLGTAITLLSAINLVAAFWAFVVARPVRERANTPVSSASGVIHRLPLILALATGVISFAYEILWTRILVHHLGADVYAFGMMLTVLLLGIAGGAWILRLRPPRSAGRAFALAQVMLAIAALISFKLLTVVSAPSLTEGGFWSITGLRMAYVSAMLLPPSVLIGLSLPLAIYWINEKDGDRGGRSVGIAYACNTLGAIVGALAAALWILPTFGFATTALFCVAGNLGLGLVSWLNVRANGILRPGLVLLSVVVGLIVFWPRSDESLFRTSPLGGLSPGSVAFTGVGLTSTVTLLDQGLGFRVLTNGLPESVIQRHGEDPSQFAVSHWLSMLPLTLRPDATSLLVVGLGGAGTIEDLPAQLGSIDVVELERRVLDANLSVASQRRSDPLADPRVSVHVNDARMELKRTSRKFDIIVSQPSHPWTSGAAHLYTKEFFELVRSRLADGGAYSQWIGLRFVDKDLIRSIIATLRSVFPHVQVYAPQRQGAMILIASETPLPVSIEKGFGRFADQWATLGVRVPEALLTGRHLHGAGLDSVASGADLITDYHNRLKYAAPRILGQPAGVPGFLSLVGANDSILGLEETSPSVDSASLLYELGQGPVVRSRRFAASDPAALALVNTWNYRGDGRSVDLTPALRSDRYQALARQTLFERSKQNLLRGDLLPQIRVGLAPDVEFKLLDIANSLQAGRPQHVRDERQWLNRTFLPTGPLADFTVQLQGRAATMLGDQQWACDLLNAQTPILYAMPPLRFRLALLCERPDDALSALRVWQNRIGKQTPGEPFRTAVEQLRVLGAAVTSDRRFQMAEQLIGRASNPSEAEKT